MALFRSLAIAAVGAALLCGEDPVAALARRVEQGTAHLAFKGPYGYLPDLLDALRVPVESQIAVFSKTSIQSMRIEPANPRVIYFNDSVSVGWVRGGFLELAAQDPGNGIRYYVLQQRPDERLTRREDCVRCHASGALQARSVVAAPDGIPSHETEVDSRTPFGKLFGGWYVTGVAVPASMGNAVTANAARRTVAPTLNAKVALRPSSDVVALMVFTHQMRMMNLLAHPENIDELVDYMVFAGEPPLPAPLRGDSGFATKFSGEGPRDRLGRSLRDFDLERRLMRYPCTYMIYSPAFDALPAAAKEAIYRRLGNILSGKVAGSRYSQLDRAGREAAIEILRETKPGLPAWFARAQ